MKNIILDKVSCNNCGHIKFNFSLPKKLPIHLHLRCSKCDGNNIVFELASSTNNTDLFSEKTNINNENFNGFKGSNGIKSAKILEIWTRYLESELPYKLQFSGDELGYYDYAREKESHMHDIYDDHTSKKIQNQNQIEWYDEDYESF